MRYCPLGNKSVVVDSRPSDRLPPRRKKDATTNYFINIWQAELREEESLCRITAQAVTGEDGAFLEDGIDLSSACYSQHEDPYPDVSLCKGPRREKILSDIERTRSEVRQNRFQHEERPRTPRKVRNTVTGHVFDWHPLMHVSENDDLEVIAWFG